MSVLLVLLSDVIHSKRERVPYIDRCMVVTIVQHVRYIEAVSEVESRIRNSLKRASPAMIFLRNYRVLFLRVF
jgi:hypothetical protein